MIRRTIMLTAALLLVVSVSGCAEGPAQERHDKAVEIEGEAIDWLEEIKASRARVIAAINKLEGLRGTIPDGMLSAAKDAAAIELAALNAEVEEATEQREQAAEVVALRGDELEAARARDASWLGLGDVGAAVAGTFGIGFVGTLWGGAKRVRSQRLKGEELTAAAMRDHINLLRSDPALDQAFRGLPDNLKKSADTALTALPHVLALIKKK